MVALWLVKYSSVFAIFCDINILAIGLAYYSEDCKEYTFFYGIIMLNRFMNSCLHTTKELPLKSENTSNWF